MDNKKLGFLILVIGVIFIIIVTLYKLQIDRLTNELMIQSGGSCFYDSGECIHQQSSLPFVIAVASIVSTIGLGIYLILFSKATISFETTQKNILKKIDTTKNIEKKKERFEILLSGLDEFEQKILRAIKEQDGISQSTLRYRTDLTKAKLSMVLSQLEKKGLVTKVKKGKINNIFLKKAL